MIEGFAEELGLQVRFFQTNAEHEFIEHLHRLEGMADAVVLNPGAWTHYVVGDPRRAGDRGAARRRGAPVGHQEPVRSGAATP